MTIIRSDAFGPTYNRLPERRKSPLNRPAFTGRGPIAESAPWDDDEPAAPVLRFPATHKQITFLVSLAAERGINLIGIVCEADPMDPTKIYLDLETGECIPKIEKRDASKGISEYLNMPKISAKPTAPKVAARVEITEDGMYRTPTGEIFKVQKAVHGSGHLYAKRLMLDQDPDTGITEAWFEYAAGQIRKLRPEWKMTFEQAKEFGALYGVCCCCSKDLTHEDSIFNGYGRKCAGNNGWPYDKAPKIQKS